MCLNTVTGIRKYLFPVYQSIKRYSDFEEYFIPDLDHPYYYWNAKISTFLEHLMFATITDDTCVKPSMAPQAYKVFSTRTHEISGRKIISRILHLRASNLGGINGYDQSDLSTLKLKNGEQFEYFHSRIIIH